MSTNRAFLLVFVIFILSVLSGCLTIENQFSGLPPGPWRGVLKLENIPIMPNPRGEPLPEKVNYQFEEITGGELPFLFNVVYDDRDHFHIELITGDEKVRLDNITLALDRSTAKDTLRVKLPQGRSISGIFEENVIEGEWNASETSAFSVPFVARHGREYLFTSLRKPPVTNLSGRWEASLGIELAEPQPAIVEFTQQGNELKATIFSEKTTYSNLAGTIQADKLYLSFFDGVQAYLLEAKIQKDDTLLGSFHSAPGSKVIWEAVRNPDAELSEIDNQ